MAGRCQESDPVYQSSERNASFTHTTHLVPTHLACIPPEYGNIFLIVMGTLHKDGIRIRLGMHNILYYIIMDLFIYLFFGGGL